MKLMDIELEKSDIYCVKSSRYQSPIVLNNLKGLMDENDWKWEKHVSLVYDEYFIVTDKENYQLNLMYGDSRRTNDRKYFRAVLCKMPTLNYADTINLYNKNLEPDKELSNDLKEAFDYLIRHHHYEYTRETSIVKYVPNGKKFYHYAYLKTENNPNTKFKAGTVDDILKTFFYIFISNIFSYRSFEMDKDFASDEFNTELDEHNYRYREMIIHYNKQGYSINFPLIEGIYFRIKYRMNKELTAIEKIVPVFKLEIIDYMGKTYHVSAHLNSDLQHLFNNEDFQNRFKKILYDIRNIYSHNSSLNEDIEKVLEN